MNRQVNLLLSIAMIFSSVCSCWNWEIEVWGFCWSWQGPEPWKYSKPLSTKSQAHHFLACALKQLCWPLLLRKWRSLLSPLIPHGIHLEYASFHVDSIWNPPLYMEYVLAEIPLILGSPFHLESIWNGDGMAKFHMEWWNVHVDSIWILWNDDGMAKFHMESIWNDIIKKKYINIGSSTKLCILVSSLGQVTWPFHTRQHAFFVAINLYHSPSPPLPPPTTRNGTTRVLPRHPVPAPQPTTHENTATERNNMATMRQRATRTLIRSLRRPTW